jgi:hypothetical protein
MGEAVGLGLVAVGKAIAEWWGGLTLFGKIMAVAYAAMTAFSVVKMLTMNTPSYSPEGGSHLQNTKTSQAVIPLVYGKSRLGVNFVFASTAGPQNKYLHIVAALCEGPVQSIDQIWLNDRKIESFGYHAYFETFTGTATQNVCATLRSVFPTWNDPMRYTAYIYLRLMWEMDESAFVFQSIPNITVDVTGLKVLDPSTGTIAWSDNPALCTYDFMTRPSVRGGMGIDRWHGPVPESPRIDVASVHEASQYCISKGWTMNFPVGDTQAFSDNLQLLLMCYRGDVIYSQTKFYFKFKDLNYEPVVGSVEMKNIVSENGRSSLRISQTSAVDRPNSIRAKYLTGAGDSQGRFKYQIADYVYTDQAALALDGDYREEEVKLYGLNAQPLIQVMSYYWLERMRWNKGISFMGDRSTLQYDAHDLIKLSHDFPMWEDKIVRVVVSSGNNDMMAAINCVEEDEILYDDIYNITEDQWDTTLLPDPSELPPDVSGITLSEVVYYYRERSFTKLKVHFDGPDPEAYAFWAGANVYVSIGDDTDFRMIATRCTGEFFIDPVQEGQVYYIKIQSENIWRVKSNYASAPVVSRTILGKTSSPSNLTHLSASVVNDSVYVRGLALTEPDIAGYEFRISGLNNTSWEAAIYLAFNTHPVWQLTGMRSGSFRIFCCAKGNNKIYSDNAVSTTFTIGVPRGYTLLQNTHLDYDDADDTLNNVQFYDEGAGQYALRVIHSGGLSGTYTSRVIDLGASKTVRVQGDFLTKLVDSTATWDAIYGLTDAWNTKNLSLPWMDIFGISSASQISAILRWGTVYGSYTGSADLFHLMAVEATARYFRVEVTITDPHNSQYLMLVGQDGDTVLTITFYQ